jgi:hypothetical protein
LSFRVSTCVAQARMSDIRLINAAARVVNQAAMAAGGGERDAPPPRVANGWATVHNAFGVDSVRQGEM